MTKLDEHEQRISVLEAQVARLLDSPSQTDELQTELTVTLNAPPTKQIQTRGKVHWVRRADECPALSDEEWDRLEDRESDE